MKYITAKIALLSLTLISLQMHAAEPTQDKDKSNPTATTSEVEEVEAETVMREAGTGEDPLAAQTTEIEQESIDREAGAGEDPLTKQTTEAESKPGYRYKDHTSYDAYGSARLRYSKTNQESDFSDGGSRIGLNGELQFHPSFWLLGRLEVGFNLADSLQELLKNADSASNEDANASKRLIYGGIQTTSTTLTYGKNWSSYYQVSGLSDRFDSFGGEASGTFNANTDGGASGTGRADRVLQGRFSIDTTPEKWHLKPFKLNVQVQQNEAIPYGDGARYNQSIGISALLQSNSEKVLGIAYNHALIDDDDRVALRAQGINGDARALVLGTRRFADRYYLGTTISFLDNHETTDTGQYFKGWGWELFGSYNVFKHWWLTGGWNVLQPESDDPLVGKYRLRYAILGMRYSFKDLRKYAYVEIRQDDSRNVDGDSPGNVYSVGVRWDVF